MKVLVVSDPLGCIPPNSSIHVISQARILENSLFSHSFPSLGDLPNPGTEPRSPALQADSLPSEPPRKPWIKGEKYLFPPLQLSEAFLSFFSDSPTGEFCSFVSLAGACEV